MKIIIDDTSYLEVKLDLNNSINLIIKNKQGNKTTVLSAKLDSAQLDKLLSQLISIKAKVK